MVLGGLWHGAAWTFVLWGLFHGLLLIAYRSAQRIPAVRTWLLGPTAVARVLGWAVMFHFTCLGWLIFRARSVGTSCGPAGQPGLRLRAADRRRPGGARAAGCSTRRHCSLVHACEAYFDDVLVVRRLPIGVRYSVYAATFYLTMLFGNFGGSDFIYFQF